VSRLTRITNEQAAILGAYTGILMGPFPELQEYIERKLRRPVLTHELADKATWEEIKKATRSDFDAVAAEPGHRGLVLLSDDGA
jgi:hypothetical protein